jgi:predicted permease
MILLQQMVVLFILMMVGAICRFTGLMDDKISKGMSGIVINIASPAFIITAGMNKEEIISNSQLLACFISVIGIYAAFILIAIVLPHILRLEKRQFGTYRVITIFSNIGFMGFPIISATYGNVGLLYAAFFQFGFNLIIYTYGIQAMQSSAESVEKPYSFSVKSLLNAGVIAVFIALILYLSHVHVPEPIAESITFLGNLTVPMSMMVIGYSLGGTKWKSLLKDYKLLIFSFIKLIVIPLIGMPIIKLFTHDQILIGVCYIMISTPVASMCAMLAQYYGGDEETATRAIAITTLLSVITIPLVGLIVV